MLTAKKLVNHKLDSESKQIYMTQQNKQAVQQQSTFVDDDSIIKILPGLPGGKHLAELTPFEAEESEIKQGDSLVGAKAAEAGEAQRAIMQIKINQVKTEAARQTRHKRGVKSIKYDEPGVKASKNLHEDP